MAGIYRSPLRGIQDTWSSRPGYTNFGELSDADKALLNSYTGDYSPTDIIWGMNGIKGFFRKALGRDPYAISNEFMNNIRQGGNAAEAATNAGGGGGGLKGFFGKFNEGFGGKPFKLDGKTLGSAANKAVTYAPAAIEGFKALGNLSEYDEASNAVDDYVSKINALASGTPRFLSYSRPTVTVKEASERVL